MEQGRTVILLEVELVEVSVGQIVKMVVDSLKAVDLLMKFQLFGDTEKYLVGHLDKRHVEWLGYELDGTTSVE